MQIFTYVFDRCSLIVLLLFPLLIIFFVFCTVFDSVPNIDDVLSMNLSANMFVSKDYYVHYKG